MTIRMAFIDGGVSYHHALGRAGAPFADYERVGVLDLVRTPLEEYDLIVVPRSTDSEVLHARRFQFRRFLDQGGVLVAFGEQPAAWFPGCDWAPECPEDVDAPVITTPHSLTEGFSAEQLEWHPRRHSWCCHGHFTAPDGAEVLVANRRGDAWLYVDRVSSRGVILTASNLDPDTHTFHGSVVARELLARILSWACREAAVTDRPSQQQIAGLYSGVHFQRSFYEHPEFAGAFSVVPAAELAALPLHRYPAIWIPRESNQQVLMDCRDHIVAYLAAGGTVVSFEEANQPWLPRANWTQEKVDLDRLTLAEHPLLSGLTMADVRWHSHGAFQPYAEAESLVADADGKIALYLDRRSFAGRILAGTMDPDCHAGFGSGRTLPLLRRLVAWAGAPAPSPHGEVAGGQAPP